MQYYPSISGQSIYDVCLQTYGSFDYLFKLMTDNGILGLNAAILGGTVFAWDDTIIQNKNLNASYLKSKKIFATDYGTNGSVLFVNIGSSNVATPASIVQPVTPASSTANAGKTLVTLATQFTSSADGTTNITPMDAGNVANLAGCDLIQIEKEIRPLATTSYVWNKVLGVLTLINGTQLDAGETIFLIYQKYI